MKKKSKRYREILKNIIKDKKVDLKTALELVKKNSTTKFDESIDVSLKINLKQSKGGDFSLRTVVNLPNGSGKKNRVAVLCEADKVDVAKKAGADIAGSDDLLDKIATGKFDFTKLICIPAMMGKIGKHGKVLGPKGLMPNPKLGTVTTDIAKAVFPLKPAGIIEHLQLKHPRYQITSAYGHFGREEDSFTWEQTGMVEALKLKLTERN